MTWAKDCIYLPSPDFGKLAELDPALRALHILDSAPAALYNLDADPGETKNLHAERPQLVKELSALLE